MSRKFRLRKNVILKREYKLVSIEGNELRHAEMTDEEAMRLSRYLGPHYRWEPESNAKHEAWRRGI